MRTSFSYRPPHGQGSGSRRLLAVTALVIVLFIIDIISGGKIRSQLRAGEAALSGLVSRTWSAVTGTGIFSTRASLEARNRSLQGELAQLEERAGSYDVLREENAQLRALLNLAGQSRGVTAPIVSSVRSSPYGTFLIGAGANDGITRGSLVLTAGEFVVGTVSDTGAHTATVVEAFAPGASIDGVLNGAAFVISGSGGGNGEGKVPRGITVAAGDPVFAPAFGQRAIGIVGAVASSTASASQEVYIRLPVNLASLQFIYVVPAR